MWQSSFCVKKLKSYIFTVEKKYVFLSGFTHAVSAT